MEKLKKTLALFFEMKRSRMHDAWMPHSDELCTAERRRYLAGLAGETRVDRIFVATPHGVLVSFSSFLAYVDFSEPLLRLWKHQKPIAVYVLRNHAVNYEYPWCLH